MKRMAVDIGGTFTDITYIDDETMEIFADKTKTTPEGPSEGVLEAIRKIRVDPAKIAIFIHGTTVGVNAVIQRKGAKVGLITTKGFRDVLEIARGDRVELYNYSWKKPKQLVPRYNIGEVSERTNVRGEIIEKLNEKEVEVVTKKLRKNGVEAIAVCLLNSYANPAHEKKIRKIVEEIWPGVPISISSGIIREYREYERMTTTVLDAYIKDVMERYLTGLEQGLRDMKFTGQFLLTSASGALSVDLAKERVITTISSGPIGGSVGSAHFGQLLGIKNLLAIDVGGTSFDLSLVREGKNIETMESQVLGFPLLVPSIDIRTIGAGGGSIARVDSAGMLHVGPESAGAVPGPRCYGTGGVESTVTDAALVSGLINPEYFLGGEMSLDVNAARKGVGSIAKRLALNINEAADGILTVARSNMTSAVREILVGRGYDPRDFAIVAYGGAGGIFAGGIAKDMDIATVIIPFNPAVYSAWGMLSMDIVHNFSQTYICYIDDLDIAKVNDIYKEMERSALEVIKREGVPEDRIELTGFVDMKYEWQGHWVEVPLPYGELTEGIKAEISQVFHQLHKVRYGHQMQFPIQAVNFRLKAIGKIRKTAQKEIDQGKEVSPNALKSKRRVYLDGRFVECPIYERKWLLYGNNIDGPAIIEEPSHTTVVMSDQRLLVDRWGNLVINTGGANC